MTLTFFLSLIYFSTLFFYSKNPLSLGLILIFQTISLALLFTLMNKLTWFLYLLIMVFVGGMLVLFIYVTSIFPNEKFFFKQTNIFYIILISMPMFIVTLKFNSLLLMSLDSFNFKNWLIFLENFLFMASTKIFYSQTKTLLILLISYLFYSMIVVIKIINFHQGPLRKMLYV